MNHAARARAAWRLPPSTLTEAERLRRPRPRPGLATIGPMRQAALSDPSAGDRLQDRPRLGCRREAWGIPDGGVIEAVRDELVDRGVIGQAEVAHGPTLVDVAKELLDRTDGDGGGGRLWFRTGRDAERDPDEAELAVARAEVEAEDLGQDGRQCGPMGDLAARSDRMTEGMDEPDTGPARLADAGEV